MKTNKKINQFIYLSKKHYKAYLGIAVLVVLFIQFFQPFSIQKFDFENKLLFISGFGLIVFISLFIAQIVFQSRLIQAENEFAGNSIYLPLYLLSQTLTASLGIIFYIHYVGQISITLNTVVRVVFICISLPVTISLKNKLDSYQFRVKKLLNETRAMKEKLRQFSESYANKYVEIISENDSGNFRIKVSEIVFARSADNYVEVGYHDEGGVKKKIIRNTLRNIEQQLSEFNSFIRTHRTSLVNIQYINKLNKNFNNYWLSLHNTKESIPVSRQYLLAVKNIL